MMNLKIFDKNSPDSGKYRGCVKSAEVLARIDKALASKHVDENELKELERMIGTASLVYPAPYLMIALFNPNHTPTSQTMKVAEQPAPKATPIEEPVIDNDNDKGTGEPGLGIEDPTLNPGVGHPADEGTEGIGNEATGEPTPEPIEPVGEGIPEGEPMNTEETETSTETETPTEEPVNEEKVEEKVEEPAPTEEPAPAETEQPKAKRGGRKKADAAE